MISHIHSILISASATTTNLMPTHRNFMCTRKKNQRKEKVFVFIIVFVVRLLCYSKCWTFRSVMREQKILLEWIDNWGNSWWQLKKIQSKKYSEIASLIIVGLYWNQLRITFNYSFQVVHCGYDCGRKWFSNLNRSLFPMIPK